MRRAAKLEHLRVLSILLSDFRELLSTLERVGVELQHHKLDELGTDVKVSVCKRISWRMCMPQHHRAHDIHALHHSGPPGHGKGQNPVAECLADGTALRAIVKLQETLRGGKVLVSLVHPLCQGKSPLNNVFEAAWKNGGVLCDPLVHAAAVADAHGIAYLQIELGVIYAA